MDWHRSMRQTPRYCEVDPASWRDVRVLDSVVSCKVTRDVDGDTRESAQITFDGPLSGEMWVRCYLDCEQDGKAERVPVGTWLVQTPSRKLDGKVSEVSAVAYSALHPLREEKPPVLWHAAMGSDCALAASQLCEDYGVAPVIRSGSSTRLADHYVAPVGSSALEVARTLAAAAGDEVSVDAMGNVVLEPVTASLAMLPSWTFRDDRESIILPDATEHLDWYSLPNVCEVVEGDIIGRAVNDDPSSMLSTVSRGRRVVLRVEGADELKSGPTQEMADLVASRRLAEACGLERTVEVSHGFCPLRAGECAELDWRAMGLKVTGRVRRQEIDVATGVTVRSTIVSESERWGTS